MKSTTTKSRRRTKAQQAEESPENTQTNPIDGGAGHSEPINTGEPTNPTEPTEPSDPTDHTEHQEEAPNVILQLAIPSARLDELMDRSNMYGVLEYNPTLTEPQPYEKDDAFLCENDVVEQHHEEPEQQQHKQKPDGDPANTGSQTGAEAHHACTCFWCCHPITHMQFGLPIRYDVNFKSFTLFGTFCSLECAAAYNYAEHMGSDRLWEIHSWIQMIAHRYGYTEHVRPAPSRFLLKMFNGPLGIEEFRAAHKGLAHTLCMNIPPFIHVNSQMEVLNTSFLETKRPACSTRAPKKKSVIATKTAAPPSIFPSTST